MLIAQYKVPDEPIKVVAIPDKDINTESLHNMADNFEKQLHAPKCDLNDLEVLTWDILTDYVEKAKKLCLQEMSAITSGGNRIDPVSLFVPIHSKENNQ